MISNLTLLLLLLILTTSCNSERGTGHSEGDGDIDLSASLRELTYWTKEALDSTQEFDSHYFVFRLDEEGARIRRVPTVNLEEGFAPDDDKHLREIESDEFLALWKKFQALEGIKAYRNEQRSTFLNLKDHYGVTVRSVEFNVREESYSIPKELDEIKIVDWINSLQESIGHAFHGPEQPDREQDDGDQTPPAVVD